MPGSCDHVYTSSLATAVGQDQKVLACSHVHVRLAGGTNAWSRVGQDQCSKRRRGRHWGMIQGEQQAACIDHKACTEQ